MTVKYFYLHDDENNRHVAVARTVDFEANQVRFGYCVSHPNDKYDKRLARVKSEGRMKSVKYSHVVKLNDDRPIEAVLKWLAANCRYEISVMATVRLLQMLEKKEKASDEAKQEAL